MVRVTCFYALTKRGLAQLIQSDVLERNRVKRGILKVPLCPRNMSRMFAKRDRYRQLVMNLESALTFHRYEDAPDGSVGARCRRERQIWATDNSNDRLACVEEGETDSILTLP
jgi:hypothetical protein